MGMGDGHCQNSHPLVNQATTVFGCWFDFPNSILVLHESLVVLKSKAYSKTDDLHMTESTVLSF